MHYVQREKLAPPKPGESAYEYAIGLRVEAGDVVVERWVPQAEAMQDDRAGMSAEEAARWAKLLGCFTTRFEAEPAPEPTPAIDPDDARRARVAMALHEAVEAAIKAEDVTRAHEVIALMSDEERARWSAPMPEHAEREATADAAAKEQAATAEARAHVRAAAEQAALALAEVKRRASEGDEKAQAILKARDEAAAIERARKAEEAKRIAEAQAIALAEMHAGLSTDDLVKALDVAATPMPKQDAATDQETAEKKNE